MWMSTSSSDRLLGQAGVPPNAAPADLRSQTGLTIRRELIDVPTSRQPVLSVVVHTDEEFDWSRFDRNATSVTHMRHIDRAQDVFDAHGIIPTYVVDYPIADQEIAYRPLRKFGSEGRALIGAHLHPWVSPPLVEEV